MGRLIPLLAIAAGVVAGKLVTAALGIGYDYWLLTAILVAAPLIVLEVWIIDRLPDHVRRHIRMDGTPFPFFTLGVATGIVLIGRGVI